MLPTGNDLVMAVEMSFKKLQKVLPSLKALTKSQF